MTPEELLGQLIDATHAQTVAVKEHTAALKGHSAIMIEHANRCERQHQYVLRSLGGVAENVSKNKGALDVIVGTHRPGEITGPVPLAPETHAKDVNAPDERDGNSIHTTPKGVQISVRWTAIGTAAGATVTWVLHHLDVIGKTLKTFLHIGG